MTKAPVRRVVLADRRPAVPLDDIHWMYRLVLRGLVALPALLR